LPKAATKISDAIFGLPDKVVVCCCCYLVVVGCWLLAVDCQDVIFNDICMKL